MAFKRRRKATRAKRRKRPSQHVVVVGKRRRSRRVSGVGRTTHHRRRRRKPGLLGSTGGGVTFTKILKLGGGIAIGASIVHFGLRPLEHKLVERFPMAAKFMAGAEVLLGGYMALKMKNEMGRAVGIGILAGGVHGVMKQFNLNKELPGIHGSDDYSVVRIPMNGNGDVRTMVAGLLNNNTRSIRTNTVAGDIVMRRTAQVAGDFDDVDSPYMPKGFNY